MSDVCRCRNCEPEFRIPKGQCVFCNTKGAPLCEECLTKSKKLLGIK